MSPNEQPPVKNVFLVLCYLFVSFLSPEGRIGSVCRMCLVRLFGF
jgi:hypothetical protein